MFKCSQCSVTCQRLDNLKRHIKIHDEENVFKCIDCPTTFSRCDALKRHYNIIHDNGNDNFSFKCDVCNKIFNRKDNLNRHMRCHQNSKKSLIQVRHNYQ